MIHLLSLLGIHTWQDAVFSIGALWLGIAMIPTALEGVKIPLKSVIPTAIIVSVFGYAFYSLGFYFSMSAEVLSAVVWWWIVWNSRKT